MGYRSEEPTTLGNWILFLARLDSGGGSVCAVAAADAADVLATAAAVAAAAAALAPSSQHLIRGSDLSSFGRCIVNKDSLSVTVANPSKGCPLPDVR